MKRKYAILLAALTVVVVIALLIPFNRRASGEKISRFGEY